MPWVNVLHNCQVRNLYRINIASATVSVPIIDHLLRPIGKHPESFLSFLRSNSVIALGETFHQYQHLASSVFLVNQDSMWCVQEQELFVFPLGTEGVDGHRWRDKETWKKYKSGVLGSFNLYLTPFGLAAKDSLCLALSCLRDWFRGVSGAKLCHTLRPVTSEPGTLCAREKNVALCLKQVLLLSTRSKTRQRLQHLSVWSKI